MKKLSIFCFGLFCLSANILAQATLQGKVTEARSGDDILNAYVRLLRNGFVKTTVATDWNGNYVIQIEEEGNYDVEVLSVGMEIKRTRGLFFSRKKIKQLEIRNLDFKLEDNSMLIGGNGLIIVPYRQPIIRADNMTSGATYSTEQIARSPR